MFDDNKGYYEIQLDNKWLIIIFIVFVVILGLVFVWGMKVGKDTAELEIGMQAKGSSPADENAVFSEHDLTADKGADQWNTAGKRDNLETYDLKTGLVEDKSAKPETEKQTQNESVKKPETKTNTNTTAPKQTEKESADIGEALPGAYLVQILSIKDKDKAEYYARVLKDEGFPAYLTKVELGSQGYFYRVRVGGYKTKEEAQVQIAKILAEDKLQPILKGKKNLLIIKQF